MDMKLIVGLILLLALVGLAYSVYYAITTKARNDAKTRANEKIFMAKMMQRENALDERYNEPTNYTPVEHNADTFVPRDDIKPHGLSNAYALSQQVDYGVTTVNVNDEPVATTQQPYKSKNGVVQMYDDNIDDITPTEAPVGKKLKDFIHD